MLSIMQHVDSLVCRFTGSSLVILLFRSVTSYGGPESGLVTDGQRTSVRIQCASLYFGKEGGRSSAVDLIESRIPLDRLRGIDICHHYLYVFVVPSTDDA